MKSIYNEVSEPWKRDGESPLEVMAFQETNELDGLSIQPLVVELCLVEIRMKMSFRDTW